MLTGKKILLIIPKYFGYEAVIEEEIGKLGAEVFVIVENIDNVSYKYRFIKNYIPQIFPQEVDALFLKQIDRFPTDVDYVFVIRGEFISINVMDHMKRRYGKSCKFVMYQWDSVKNNQNVLRISSKFDTIATFDLEDAESYHWKYRPLFFVDKYLDIEQPKSIDVLFVGSLHSNRVAVLNYMKQYCNERDMYLMHHIYSKRLIYFKRRYLNKRREYRLAENSDIKFKPLSLKECYEKYNHAKIVVDYTHPGQTGYTMRTIECLGCNCKLITNNRMVLQSDFFNPENIYVYEGINIDVPDTFINTNYKEIEPAIKEEYSISRWILDIIG